MNIFYRFLSKVSVFILVGCASSSDLGSPGFQKTYPWTFTPYTNAPWTSKVSFNDFIDLETFYLINKEREHKAQQDKEYGYPINALSDSLMYQY